jgi:hypothetical protein
MQYMLAKPFSTQFSPSVYSISIAESIKSYENVLIDQWQIKMNVPKNPAGG